MNELDLSKIPARACIMCVGEFELKDNGEKSKTAPVRLVARTGKAIEHWFWGRVVHDLAGMHLSKSRIPIDYVHDSKEIVGYLNHFDTASGDLVTSGALVPFKESDRATEIIHKSRAGVPYEASINFGGDGIKVQEVGEKEITEVNGAQFEGPGIIIREWPLRGVAICPYGADANTSSSVLAENSKTFSASVVSAPEAKTKEPVKMKNDKPVEVLAQAKAPEAASASEVKLEAVEQPPVEVKPVEAASVAAVEPAPAVEAKPPEVKTSEPAAPEVKSLSREEFARIADKFGDAIAAKVMRDGGDFSTAMELAFDATKKENETLHAKVMELSKQPTTGTPVAMTSVQPKATLFKTGK
ncbi:MAG: hypothetical protein WC374_06365 [Phycisphaerae bacterium]|jgi:hypothetical protein